MAIPKPVRALAIVSAFLFFYLVFQIFRTAPPPGGPGDLEKELPNEPMLEGTTCFRNGLQLKLTTDRHRRTTRASTQSRRRICSRQPQFSSYQCDLAGAGTK